MTTKKEMNGNCYEVNGRWFVDNFRKINNLVICYGNTIGQKGTKIEGVEFGHCWIEKEDLIFDFSNGKNIVINKEDYYSLGKITKIKKYKGEEFVKIILKTKHWGPYIQLNKTGGKLK